MIDLNDLSKKAYEIACERGQYKNDGRDVIRGLKHCAGEVVEAVEAYTSIDCSDKDYAYELADIMMCVLSLCGYMKMDAELMLSCCLYKNKKRIDDNG